MTFNRYIKTRRAIYGWLLVTVWRSITDMRLRFINIIFTIGIFWGIIIFHVFKKIRSIAFG